MDSDIDAPSCNGCDLCCRYITVLTMSPKTKKDIDRMVWYIHHGAKIYLEPEDVWRVNISVNCKYLKPGFCKIYDKRPQICRDYSSLTCERNGLDELNVTVFTTEDELLKYAKDELGIE